MSAKSRRRRWPSVCLIVAIGSFLLAAACVFFGILGSIGILADVGPEENRDIAVQLFKFSLGPIGAGIVFLVAWRLGRRPPAPPAPPTLPNQ